MKKLKYQIFLFSDMLGKYAPTQHPLKDTRKAAADYARKHLKLEQNLSGKASFEVQAIKV